MFSDSIWMNSLIWYFLIQLIILYILLLIQYLIIKFASNNVRLTIVGSLLTLCVALRLFYVLVITSPFASIIITAGAWIGFVLYGCLLFKVVQIILLHSNK